MAEITSEEPIAGFEAPVHRSLIEPILLACANYHIGYLTDGPLLAVPPNPHGRKQW
jgi:type IV secretory pathway TrbD component